MKKGYYSKRILRSILSIITVVIVVFAMIFTLVPRDRIFYDDPMIQKLGGKPDEKYAYKMRTWQRLGYIDYVNINSYCSSLYEAGTDAISACVLSTSKETKDFVSTYTEQGYTIEYLPVSKTAVAYRDRPILERMLKWFSGLIVIDHPWSVQDTNNTDLERKLYLGTTPTGGVAIKCSGCTYKYLLYTDSNFPYIHQNIIRLNLGVSYPEYDGVEVLQVMGSTQGAEDRTYVEYETGNTGETSIIFGTCKYKTNLDRLDTNKFVDNYADCSTKKTTPSMIGTSFLMGVLAIILAYGVGLPAGLMMARKKDKVADKLGMVYIIFIIAVPSLAYIYIFRHLGMTLFGLPMAFPTFGAGNIKSWILPTISLALPSIASLMLWTRRYVVDQMNSDYVKFAKAKGLNEKEIFRKHIFRNAIIPIAQGIPASLAACITGAIITESVYAVGGMGKLLPDSINKYNNSMILALALIYTSISVISVLLGDVIITKVDPRISLSEKDGRS